MIPLEDGGPGGYNRRHGQGSSQTVGSGSPAERPDYNIFTTGECFLKKYGTPEIVG